MAADCVLSLLDFPTGNTDRGLGTGAIHAFFPIWLQKDFGKWSIYGGGGNATSSAAKVLARLTLGSPLVRFAASPLPP